MKTDLEIKQAGIKALTERLGPVDAEKFISLILREPFDYTEWQKSLWPNLTITDISGAAMSYREKHKI